MFVYLLLFNYLYIYIYLFIIYLFMIIIIIFNNLIYFLNLFLIYLFNDALNTLRFYRCQKYFNKKAKIPFLFGSILDQAAACTTKRFCALNIKQGSGEFRIC